MHVGTLPPFEPIGHTEDDYVTLPSGDDGIDILVPNGKAALKSYTLTIDIFTIFNAMFSIDRYL